MASQRQLKAGELIRKILSEILLKEDFYKTGKSSFIIAITEVKLSPDLRSAHVFISVIDTSPGQEVIKILNSHAGKFNYFVAKSHSMKYTPKLKFFIDTSAAYAGHIENLINQNI